MTPERDELADDVVARAWREHMNETPPAATDDAIRAAARRAVGAKPRHKPRVAEARQPWRWWMPLAAAATIGTIAIGVMQNLPQDGSEPTVVSDATTARRAPPATPAASELPSSSDRPAPATPAQAAPGSGLDAVAPGSRADAKKVPTPEERDRDPLPLPRTDVPRSRAPAAPAPPRQEAAKSDSLPRDRAPSESKEAITPPLEDRLAANALPPPADALGKGADERASLQRKNESDAASGFVASPPPGKAPGVAAAKQAAPEPPRLAAKAAPDTLGAARMAPTAPESDGRAKLRAAPEPAAAASAAVGLAEGEAVRARAQSTRTASPATFIAEIRRLLAAGDRDGAARELRRFRRTYADADARLPVDLRQFAATVAP
jgi:hypothetical protein